MSKISGIVGGIGLLIGLYLVLRHGDESIGIISTIAENSVKGIKTLQGRG